MCMCISHSIHMSNEQGQYLNFVRHWQIVLFFSAPHFVHSFAHGDFVYFFFRETAVEYINCGKVSYYYFSLFPYISLNASNLQYADPRNGVVFFLLCSIFMTNYGKHTRQMFTDFIYCLFRLLDNNTSSNGLKKKKKNNKKKYPRFWRKKVPRKYA